MNGKYCVVCETNLTGRQSRYCGKGCSNNFHNNANKINLQGLKPSLDAYKKSYLSLRRAVIKYGEGVEIQLFKCISWGLDLLTPHNPVLSEIEGKQLRRVGDYAFIINDDNTLITVYKITNHD